MKTKSCKQKGHVLCNEIKALLHKYAPDLQCEDIWVTPSGCTGEDIRLSPVAKQKYPLAIECKNQESIQIWLAIEQAASHVKDDKTIPVLFFRRNRSKTYAVIEAEQFIKWIS